MQFCERRFRAQIQISELGLQIQILLFTHICWLFVTFLYMHMLPIYTFCSVGVNILHVDLGAAICTGVLFLGPV